MPSVTRYFMSEEPPVIRSRAKGASSGNSSRRFAPISVGAVSSPWLATVIVLTARTALPQDALRGFVAGNAAAPGALQTEAMPYTFKSGDFRMLIVPSLAVDWNDNVLISNEGQQSDFIVRPTVGVNMSYPITERSLLQLNVNFGYQKYLDHDDLSTWYVQSGSALAYDLFVKDVRINLHEQFSYIQDSSQEAAVANTGSFGVLNNTVGALITWDLDNISPSLGYNHQNLLSTTPQFDAENHSTESLIGRVGFKLHPEVTAGFESTAAFTSYDQTELNNNTALTVGAYGDWQPGIFFHLQVRGGYSIFQFQQTSQTIQSANLSSWYADVTATHQILQSVSYSLSAGHDVRLGIASDAIEEWYFSPAVKWSFIRNWTFSTSVSYEHGNQGVADRSGGSAEIFDWVTVGVELSHPITDRLNAALNYRSTLRFSSENGNAYAQNLVEVRLSYQLQ